MKNMNHIELLLILLIMSSYSWTGIGASFTNFVVKSFGICNNTQRPVKYYGHVATENGKQYLTHNLTLPFPIGDKIGGTCIIQTKTIGTQFVDLFTIREKNVCKAANKYLGEFWYDIERQTGITPGVCPIQQGIYHGNHIQLQFDRISLQTFPFGTLKFTFQGIDNNNKNDVWCLSVIVENIAN